MEVNNEIHCPNNRNAEIIGDHKNISSKKGSQHGTKSPQSAPSTENISQEETIEKAVRYLEKLKIGYDIKHANDIKDSSTQTSKTIIQLAKMEKGDISPDSLSPTPRKKIEEPDIKQEEPKKKSDNSLSYSRKREVIEYINNCEIDNKEIEVTFPRCSLIETYLSSKSNSRKSQIDHENIENSSLTSDDLSKSGHSRFLEQTSPFKNLVKDEHNFQSQSYVESPFPVEKRARQQISRFTVKRVRQQSVDLSNLKLSESTKKIKDATSDTTCFSKFSPKLLCHRGRSNSFMSPTIASEQKSKLQEVKTIKRLISPTKRGRSVSPRHGIHKQPTIPYIDEPYCENTFKKRDQYKNCYISSSCLLDGRPDNFAKLDLEDKYSQDSMYDCSQINDTNSSSSSENILFTILNRIRNVDWNIALRGLAEITELCRNSDRECLYPHMICVNQRLLELLRSPRSHVCRTACQAAGHLFESMKDTRRPEFDDIVDVLLSKTADANRFIRQDANLALDCMVTHIPIYHAIRALCVKGPFHKNHLVRTATVRLVICAVVIAGPSSVLNPNSSDITRKRVMMHMAKFIEDKNMETRKYGERLYKILCKEPYFDVFLKKYLEKEDISQFKKTIKSLHRSKH